jgi:hypothetical protein
VADLVLGVIQNQRHAVELIGGAQSDDEPLEQLGEGVRAQQFQLTVLRLAQQRLVAAHLLGEGSQARLEHAVLGLECVGVAGRITHRRP